jgi:hypothetical protein
MTPKALLQDPKRYSAGRGAHINLKRAEKARILVTKIPSKTPFEFCRIMYRFQLLQIMIQNFPGMVDNLINRTFAWENARNKPFLYDGVSTILELPIVCMLLLLFYYIINLHALLLGAPNICS